MRGYLRPDGQIGIRNHIAVIYTEASARLVAEQIALRVPQAEVFGTRDLSPGTAAHLAGLGRHPNVGAVIVVGTGEEGLDDALAGTIAKSGRPVARVRVLEDGGTRQSIDKGIRAGCMMAREITQLQSVPVSLADLTIGVSWDYRQEKMLNRSVAWALSRITARRGTVLLAGRLEDPVLGEGRALVPGRKPDVPGLYYLDGQPPTLPALLSAGAQILILVTRKGNVAGTVLAPLLKVCEDAGIYRQLSGDLDINAGIISEEAEVVVEVGRTILEKLVDVAAGDLTKAELLGHKEY